MKKITMTRTGLALVSPLLLVLVPRVAISQEQSTEKAKVYVYRYKQYAGKALRPSIYCDDHDVARLQDGRGVVLAFAPGKHRFRSNDQQSEVELDLKPATEYYLRIDIAMGFWKGHGRLTLVQPEQGKAEFEKMKPADAGMIKDREFLAADFVPK